MEIICLKTIYIAKLIKYDALVSLLRDVPFIVSPSTSALLHRRRVSAGTFMIAEMDILHIHLSYTKTNLNLFQYRVRTAQ